MTFSKFNTTYEIQVKIGFFKFVNGKMQLNPAMFYTPEDTIASSAIVFLRFGHLAVQKIFK